MLGVGKVIKQLHSEGRRALLIVDEAQNLGARAIEELRMLSNFQIETKAVLQSFLIGQPELRDLMQRQEMRQLKQRIIAAYHLGPLDRSETQAYIEHRLRHVGWQNDPEFQDQTYDKVFEVSEGIPRRINTLADRLLLAGFLTERHVITASDVDDVSAEIAVELGPRQGNQPSRQTAAATLAANTNAEMLNADSMLLDPLDSLHSMPANSASHESLEERIAMLEASTTMMYGMLKRVVKLLQSTPSNPSNSAP